MYRLVYGEIVAEDVHTERKTFKVPKFEPIKKSTSFDLHSLDQVKAMNDFLYEFNGLIHPFQIALEEVAENRRGS